jgi:hypothetical protein
MKSSLPNTVTAKSLAIAFTAGSIALMGMVFVNKDALSERILTNVSCGLVGEEACTEVIEASQYFGG